MAKFVVILKVFIHVLFFNLLPPSLQARSIEFRNSTSKWNPSYFSNFTIYTSNDSVSCEFDLIRPIINDFKADIELEIRLANSKKYQKLFGYNVYVCSMVIAFKDTMFKRIFKSLLKYSNLMQNCPINEGHYYLHDWRMESSLIPSYLYAGDYRFKSRGYLHKTLKNRTKVDDFVISVTMDTVIVDK